MSAWEIVGVAVAVSMLCCAAYMVFGWFYNARRRRAYEDYEPPAPPPVLYDIPHPERYPKTWAYRAERGAEETMDIMARAYQRPRNRPNGEEL